MSEQVKCLHMNHINAVIDGFDESVEHFQDLYGAQLISDMPKDEWHACLITIGTVIFQLFAPHDDLLHARFGPHYVGIEYQIPDLELARREMKARDIRIVRELEVAFHIHPADLFGIALEFYTCSFHEVPPSMPYLEPIKPLSYWSEEHPLGCLGLKRYTVVVADLDAATTFFQEFTDGAILYRADRPAVGARAVGIGLGDTVAELLTPVTDGTIQRHLARHGDGIRSTVLAVADLERAKSHFEGQGIELKPGDAPDTLAIRPEDNRGLLFEFAE